MAWLNITDRTGADPNASADIDQLMEDIRVVAGNGVAAPPDDCTGLDARVTVLEGTTITAKEHYTRVHGGQHYRLLWKDADEVVLKPEHAQGLGAWIGVVLNDNKYLESTTDITLKYDTPANSGHIIDGITAKLASVFLRVWLYEDSGGALAGAFTLVPSTTFSNANPTNTLTLNQVNGQDIGYLFPEDAHLIIWQDADEWENPLAWQNAGAITYDATKDKPKVSSRTATVLTLGANLENNNFTASSTVKQVDGFKPLQVSDGDIASAISTRGYLDTGWVLRTDVSGNIIQFTIMNDEFHYVNGSGGADYAVDQGLDYTVINSGAYGNMILAHVPVDKTPIIFLFCDANSIAYFRDPYNSTYGNVVARGVSAQYVRSESLCKYGVVCPKNAYAAFKIATRGYINDKFLSF